VTRATAWAASDRVEPRVRPAIDEDGFLRRQGPSLATHEGSATKVGTINSTGVGGVEVVEYTVGAAGRQVSVVLSANALQGWYTIKLEKKS